MGKPTEIQTVLVNLADEIWTSTSHPHGFTQSGVAVQLDDALSSSDQDMFDEWYGAGVDDFGLPSHILVHLVWNAGGPGMGSIWGITSVELPSGRHMYIQYNDNAPGLLILSVSTQVWSPDIDRKFLWTLFKNNGADFGTEIFGGPPNSVSTCPLSIDTIVDMFVSAFDAAGDYCWDDLLSRYGDGDDDPPEDTSVTEEVYAKARAIEIGRHGEPKSLNARMSQNQRVTEIAQEMMIRANYVEGAAPATLGDPTSTEQLRKERAMRSYLTQSLTDFGLG